MRLQVEEANAAVIREREAARKAIEEAPPVIKETPVLVEDTEKINSLTSEVEALKVCFFFLTYRIVLHMFTIIASRYMLLSPLVL